jgi:hypothetical protein
MVYDVVRSCRIQNSTQISYNSDVAHYFVYRHRIMLTYTYNIVYNIVETYDATGKNCPPTHAIVGNGEIVYDIVG